MTTREVIEGELGLGKIGSRRILIRLRFWNKIVEMKKKNRLVYKVYKQRREEFEKGERRDKKNWCYWTWKYLKDLHLEHIWESEKSELGRNFSELVRKLVKNKEEEEWQDKINKKSKLRLYRKLKSSRLVIEEYFRIRSRREGDAERRNE